MAKRMGTDIIALSADKLSGLKDSLLRHAHMTGTSTRVLRYLDRPLTKTGKPDRRSSDDVITRLTDFNDVIRCRHRVGNNSVKVYKVYNKQNVLRFETTINDPGKFLVFRHKQGESENTPKQHRPMRKSVNPERGKVDKYVECDIVRIY